MSAEAKRWLVAALSLIFLGSLVVVGWRESATERKPGERAKAVVSADSKECVDCHAKTSPGIVAQWRDSKHATRGIGCATCHAADKKDPDAFEHHGITIATIVSPLDCSRCHPNEFEEQKKSRHAEAASFTSSLDNFLGDVVEGATATPLGCNGCHGTTVKVLAGGKLDPTTWPNGGMGRINPDGSKGSCASCHYRHDFSLAVARGPDTCGKCHMGPDHPQFEVYSESKHGVRFRELHDQMHLDAQPWVVGRDYHAAPTCATCHMSATPTQKVTHDPGTRIAWTLRPIVSVRQPDWEQRRDDMLDVCGQCHSEQWAQNYFTQFDAFVDLYNRKFAEPSKLIMDALYANKRLTAKKFDEPIEYTFFELWHHEGRRARHGAAMMGPDFVQWHGAYEVAKTFYTRLVPEAERMICALGGVRRNPCAHGRSQGRRQAGTHLAKGSGRPPGGPAMDAKPFTILVGVDFGDTTLHAMAEAARIARRTGGALEVVHIAPSAIAAPIDMPQSAGELADAQRRIGELCAIAEADGIPARAHLRMGEAAEGLLGAIEELRPDLVVVCSRGRGALVRALLGSVCEALWRRSPIPVVIVPPEAPAARAAAPQPADALAPAIGHGAAEGEVASSGTDRVTASLFPTAPAGSNGTDINPELRVRY
jgi:hydroxylamine dehydrogenase